MAAHRSAGGRGTGNRFWQLGYPRGGAPEGDGASSARADAASLVRFARREAPSSQTARAMAAHVRQGVQDENTSFGANAKKMGGVLGVSGNMRR